MKKLISLISIVFLAAGMGFAQKYAFVDTEYILDRIPSYKAAQDQLDKLAGEWQEEVEGMYESVDTCSWDYSY